MNNNQRFDNNIKEQFQDYSPDVHPRIWENIVKERERRRPIGFWKSFLNSRNALLLAGLLLATASGAYLLLKKTTAKEATVIAANSTNPQPSAAAEATTATTVGDNNNTIAAEKNTAATPQNDGTNTGTTNDAATVTATNQTNIAANDNGSNTLNNSSTTKTNGFTSFSSKGAVKIKIQAPVATGDESSGFFTGKKKKTRSAAGSSNDYEAEEVTATAASLIAENNYLRKLSFTSPEKTAAEKKALLLKKSFVPNIFLPDCPSIEKDAAGNKSYIEVYGGPDIAFRSMSDTGNSAYLQKRKESTKFSSAFSAGIRYTKVFNNGMSIRTGINYSQINEKFTFVQGNLVQITYIINANGDTTGSYVTTGTRYKTTNNKYRTIDVPLLIGYELGNGKFHANINAGVMINAYSWQKGEVLDTAYKPVSITTGKSNSPYQFKTNIGLGFMAGVSVYYKLNEKIHLLAEPYFRYSLSPMSKEKLTLTQKYNTAGIRLGLRVDLR